ncbi:hypothetical protein [Aquimarina sp. Aq78]|uniref:hypothetical protein n=1 Tax=Aquimarina sp. Aq78 TaxID=1191889 RepID=UPI000D0E5691|nr:hypothetical protein [Aquimarina sp. Aq78]
MLKQIVQPTIINLKQAEEIFAELPPAIYSSTSAAPYYSSIGGHLRHILDIFKCIVNGIDSRIIDLTKRKRGTIVEQNPVEGQRYLRKIISDLECISGLDPSIAIIIKDDLGMGMVEIPTTLGGGLNQAHSHAIHHFACIGYILHIHGTILPNKVFGYNPTTPENQSI